MKCFIHWEAEAIAACRTCGKGMCAQCSAYSGHSGICPECRKNDFIKERENLIQGNKNLVWEIVKASFRCLLIITIPRSVYRIVKGVRRRKANTERIATLTTEIDRLNNALANRGTNTFI